VGTRQTVLVEGASKREKGDLSRGRVQGRTERSEIVHIDAPDAESLVGELVDVEITRANKHSLAGALLGTPPRAAPALVSRRLPLWQEDGTSPARFGGGAVVETR
jgi:hypothetical protein